MEKKKKRNIISVIVVIIVFCVILSAVVRCIYKVRGRLDIQMQDSLIETAKANKLKIYEYLIHVFNTLAKYEEYSDELIESLLPYSSNLPKCLILEGKKLLNRAF